MNPAHINICELAAWDFDDVSRDVADLEGSSQRARQALNQRPPFAGGSAIIPDAANNLRSRIKSLLQREDLLREYKGLQWEIGVVDLRKLLAFQRRVLLEAEEPQEQRIEPDDWDALLRLAFDGTRSTEAEIQRTCAEEGTERIVLHSWNPDLQLQFEPGAANLVRLYGGSPFFEVAHYRGRWFLRDGYHRAYNLIRSGIHAMFAVIVEARNIAEVGAVQPWFFDEATLFSERPPMVTDFHNDELVLSYSRSRMKKRITVRIEEALHPADAESL